MNVQTITKTGKVHETFLPDLFQAIEFAETLIYLGGFVSVKVGGDELIEKPQHNNKAA